MHPPAGMQTSGEGHTVPSLHTGTSLPTQLLRRTTQAKGTERNVDSCLTQRW